MAITPFKVTEYGTNRKPIYDFLLVINTNLPPIFHRFQVMADYVIFALDRGLIHFNALAWVISCEYCHSGLDKLRKTKMGFFVIDPLSPRPLWLVCPAGEAIQGELQGEFK